MFIERVYTHPHETFGFNQYKQTFLYVNFPKILTVISISRPFQISRIPYPYGFKKEKLREFWGGIIDLDRISQQYYLK